MRMFGRKAGRGAARPLLGLGLARSGVPLTGAAPSYESQVREGYLRNPVAQRAVRMVAGGLAASADFLDPAEKRQMVGLS